MQGRGSISVVEGNKVYHCGTGHPEGLCADTAELPAKFKKVVASSDLQAEVLAWLEKALDEHFVEKPLAILKETVALKAKNHI